MINNMKLSYYFFCLLSGNSILSEWYVFACAFLASTQDNSGISRVGVCLNSWPKIQLYSVIAVMMLVLEKCRSPIPEITKQLTNLVIYNLFSVQIPKNIWFACRVLHNKF